MTKAEFYQFLENSNHPLTDLQKNQFDDYFDLLNEYNQVMNLTSITEENEVFEKHYLDCLLFSFKDEFIYENKTLVDVGSGAGFPGIVLAIVYPNLSISLVEPIKKRCNFLNAVKEKLSLNNVEVLNTRSEDLVSSRRNYYDYGTSRAVARLNILLEISMPLIKKGGYFIALKGDKGNEELAESKKALTELSCKIDKVYLDHLPTNNDTRTNIFIKKIDDGKNKYPRPFAKIKKDPL